MVWKKGDCPKNSAKYQGYLLHKAYNNLIKVIGKEFKLYKILVRLTQLYNTIKRR